MSGIYIALIPLLPLVTFLVLALFGRKRIKQSSGIIGVVSMLAAAALSLYTAYQYFFVAGKVNGSYEKLIAMKYAWLQFSPGVSIDMGILLDPVSVMMIVVVTLVSLMVHIYSLGYMKGEERYSTYYAFLSLFTFSMLGLVLASNIFQIYIFWELVGVSSYLLIGFYYEKASAVAAAKKAFIVTRFADLGFLIGILILAFYTGTLDFVTLIERLTNATSPALVNITAASFLGVSMLSWGLALVFIGGAGKSAMFPLHVWLPDAMEGPTPVSALIHAATMVVAGVFLVARLFPVYAVSAPGVLNLIAWVGAFSALLAAVIACTQTDIKRVLAYSTMSQIGYMMFALGVSGYGGENGLGFMASMFHLFTHAFFKALLFLAAGAIIHLVHSNDMKDMGGLRRFMPLTHVLFLLACLSIAGIPPFAGFFSKEAILTAALQSNTLIYGIALLTAGITAFYMFRLYFSIFWNKPSQLHDAHGEGSFSMKLPMVLLAAGAVFAGFLPFENFVTSDGVAFITEMHIKGAVAPVLLALAGMLLAYRMYKTDNPLPQKMADSLGGIYRTVYHKFYIDEVYSFVTKRVLFNLIGRPAAWFDKHIVDGFMNLLAVLTGKISQLIKGLQSGKVQQYGLYFFAGIIGLTALLLYWWK